MFAYFSKREIILAFILFEILQEVCQSESGLHSQLLEERGDPDLGAHRRGGGGGRGERSPFRTK